MDILVIGAGRLGRHVISTLKHKASVLALDPSNPDDLGISCYASYALLPKKEFDAVIVCIKPKDIDALSQIHVKANIFVSFMAGVSPSMLAHVKPAPWIIGMPNLAFNPTVYYLPFEHPKISKLQDLLGASINVSSYDQVVSLTPITGCGPAIICDFLKSIQSWALMHNFNEKETNSMLLHLLKGTVSLIEEYKNFNDLIATVASPGGVTQKMLEYSKENGLEKLIHGVLNVGEMRCKNA